MAVEMGMPAEAVHRASGDTSSPGYDALLLTDLIRTSRSSTGGPNPANEAPGAAHGDEQRGHRPPRGGAGRPDPQ